MSVEVRLVLKDETHSKVKEWGKEEDLKIGEAIESILDEWCEKRKRRK